MNICRILFLVSVAAVSFCNGAAAQSYADAVPEGYELIDSVIYIPAAAVDSAYLGKNIFLIMPSRTRGGAADVTVRQSQSIIDVMKSHIKSNSSRTVSGYRVRIFFDNKQSSRTDSEAAMRRFSRLHPEIPVYRSYVNPYFKVTVGDFRTKSEAMALLDGIRHDFPKSFIVKEQIEYPVIDKLNAVKADTVKVIRKLPQ